jgi:hypothetical protein
MGEAPYMFQAHDCGAGVASLFANAGIPPPHGAVPLVERLLTWDTSRRAAATEVRVIKSIRAYVLLHVSANCSGGFSATGASCTEVPHGRGLENNPTLANASRNVAPAVHATRVFPRRTASRAQGPDSYRSPAPQKPAQGTQ